MLIERVDPAAPPQTMSDAHGAFRKDPVQWKAFCASLRVLGRPTINRTP